MRQDGKFGYKLGGLGKWAKYIRLCRRLSFRGSPAS